MTSQVPFESSASATMCGLNAVSALLQICPFFFVCMFLSVVSEICGEMGELTFIHTLTGWIPEISPLK